MAAGRNILNWLLSTLGYLLYTLVVLVVLLWLLFPADAVRSWLTARLNDMNPDLQWKVADLRAELPLRITLTGVQVGTGEAAGEPLLDIAELRVSPDFSILRLDAVPLRFAARLLQGVVEGRAVLTENLRMLDSEGKAADLQLGGLTALWQRLGRSCTGTLSGPFAFRGYWSSPLEGDFHAEPLVSRGSVELMQPLFGLELIEYSRLAAELDLEEKQIMIGSGEAESRLFAASFSGVLTPADPLFLSGVDVEGTFEPRPELLGRLENQATVTLIRDQLQDDRLAFSISGTLLEPGILFRGNSGVIDGIIQGDGGAR